MPKHTSPTGPRDATYQLRIAAESIEWLASQVRANGSLPVYGALAILTDHAAFLRALEASARADADRRENEISARLR